MINAIYPSNQIDVIPQGSGNVLLRIKAGVIPPPASPDGYTRAEVDALLAATLARALKAVPAATTVPSTLPPSGPAGGDLSGTYPNPSVVDDSHSHTPGVSIPAYPTGLPPSGAAGGDLSGTYPNPSVVDDSHAHTPGTSIPAYPTTLPPDGAAGGDLTGTYPNPTLGAVGAATGPLGSATTVAVVTIDAKGRVIALTSTAIALAASGDATGTLPGALTLASVIVAGGPVGSATTVPVITWDAKGRLTAVSSTAISGAGIDSSAVHSTGGLSAYTTGDLLYASNATTLSLLASVAAGSWLRSGGVGTAPSWSTTTLPNSAATGDLLYASAANTYANLAGVATGNALISGGVGAAPSWGKITSAHTTGLATLGANTFTALQTITQASTNAGVLASTGYSLTGSDATSMVNLAGTWNTSGTPTAIKLNITDTASNAASLLMDLGTGGGSFVSQWKVSKVGAVTQLGVLGLPAGSASAPAVTLSVDSSTGWYRSSTHQWTWVAAAVPVFRLLTGFITCQSTAAFCWTSGDATAAADTLLYRDAANTLALRNSTTSQKFRIYNTFTTVDTAGEWFAIDWKTTANVVNLQAVKGSSTGTARVMTLSYGGAQASPVAAITIPITSGPIVFGGALTTSAPVTGTAAPWKLGSLVGGQVGLALVTTQYIELDINGTLYKVATVA